MDGTTLTGLLVVALMRGAERLMLIGAGALAIWLGYRLFVQMPGAARGEGKATLPGGVSIMLSRVGPGVFFALFGCAVLGYSVARPVELDLPLGPTAEASRLRYSGFGSFLAAPAVAPGPVAGTAAGASAEEVERMVIGLNGLFAEARPHLSAPAVAEAEATLRAAKLALMGQAWAPAWGDRAAFADWVRQGAGGSAPLERAGGAVMIYNSGLR